MLCVPTGCFMRYMAGCSREMHTQHLAEGSAGGLFISVQVPIEWLLCSVYRIRMSQVPEFEAGAELHDNHAILVA